MLIDHVNRLERMLTNTNPTRDEINRLLQAVGFLESYAEMHFQFEEDCMEKHRCPVHQQNKDAHQRFRQMFEQYQARYHSEGFRPEVLKQLFEMVSEWIEHHILLVDTQLKRCISKTP